jgi:transcriptional regulator with XRE-family HTH domain
MVIVGVSRNLDVWRSCADTVVMTEQAEFAIEPEFTLGWRIKRALDYAELDHSALMNKFEVSRQTVSRWCRDDGPPPKKFILNEIAVMCGVSPRWLIDGPVRGNYPPDGGGESHLGESNPRPIHYSHSKPASITQLFTGRPTPLIPTERAS